MLYLDTRAINIAGLTFAKPVKIAHEGVSGARVTGVLCAILGGRRGIAMTRAQRRKLMNRRRRWFVDNIIMHHRRIHDKNREIVVNMAKKRMLEKRRKQNAPDPQKSKLNDRFDARKRGTEIRGRTDSRRLRARSRWLAIVGENKEKKD